MRRVNFMCQGTLESVRFIADAGIESSIGDIRGKITVKVIYYVIIILHIKCKAVAMFVYKRSSSPPFA